MSLTNSLIKLLFSTLFFFNIIILTGCASTWQKAPQSDQNQVQHDPLSYGAVNAKVKKDVTTQEEIMKLFGAPNVTTMNKNGEEVWMYDRISNSNQSNGWTEAKRFSTFFGLDSYSEKDGNSRSSTTNTLTVIITFNENKTVKEYSSRATQF